MYHPLPQACLELIVERWLCAWLQRKVQDQRLLPSSQIVPDIKFIEIKQQQLTHMDPSARSAAEGLRNAMGPEYAGGWVSLAFIIFSFVAAADPSIARHPSLAMQGQSFSTNSSMDCVVFGPDGRCISC